MERNNLAFITIENIDVSTFEKFLTNFLQWKKIGLPNHKISSLKTIFSFLMEYYFKACLSIAMFQLFCLDWNTYICLDQKAINFNTRFWSLNMIWWFRKQLLVWFEALFINSMYHTCNEGFSSAKLQPLRLQHLLKENSIIRAFEGIYCKILLITTCEQL